MNDIIAKIGLLVLIGILIICINDNENHIKQIEKTLYKLEQENNS